MDVQTDRQTRPSLYPHLQDSCALVKNDLISCTNNLHDEKQYIDKDSGTIQSTMILHEMKYSDMIQVLSTILHFVRWHCPIGTTHPDYVIFDVHQCYMLGLAQQSSPM